MAVKRETDKNRRTLSVRGSSRRETSPLLKAWLILSKHWQRAACKNIGMFIWGAAVVALMFDSEGWLLSPIHVDI